VKGFSALLKRRKPNRQQTRGRVLQLSYGSFSLSNLAISIDASKCSFTGIAGGKWPTNKEVVRNDDAPCYACKHSITSWRDS
jgi:hypothetical protein